MREVATVEEQQVGVLGTLLLEHGYAAQESAAPRLHGVGQRLAEWHDARVGVVGVKNGQRLLSEGCRHAEQHGGYGDECLIFHRLFSLPFER